MLVKTTIESLKSTIKFVDIENTINPNESEKSVFRDKKTSTTNRSPELVMCKNEPQRQKKSIIQSGNLNYSNKSTEEIK